MLNKVLFLPELRYDKPETRGVANIAFVLQQ